LVEENTNNNAFEKEKKISRKKKRIQTNILDDNKTRSDVGQNRFGQQYIATNQFTQIFNRLLHTKMSLLI
jgi:hypothetical protein